MAEAWAGVQGSFDMVHVFSSVIEDLIDRTKQCSTDNESSAHLVGLVEVASIIFTGDTALRCCKNRCDGRWICGGIDHVIMQKCLHKVGDTRLWDSTSITVFLEGPVLARVWLYTRTSTMVWILRARCRRATEILFHTFRMRRYSFMFCAGRRQLSATRRSGCSFT